MSRRCIPGAVGAHYTKLRTVRSNHVDALCALLDQLLTERSEAFVKHRPVIHLLGPDGGCHRRSQISDQFCRSGDLCRLCSFGLRDLLRRDGFLVICKRRLSVSLVKKCSPGSFGQDHASVCTRWVWCPPRVLIGATGRVNLTGELKQRPTKCSVIADVGYWICGLRSSSPRISYNHRSHVATPSLPPSAFSVCHLETFTATNQADFPPTDADTVQMNPICDLPLIPVVVPLCQSRGAIQFQIPEASVATDRWLC